MKKGIKKKIFLSNLLEQIEINRDTVEIIGKLDEFHLKAKSHVIGVTGPPGAGKSSLVDKLILEIRQNKKSVGVIAIDPSSRKSGGALLGDRTRFLLDPNDNDVFVRSMATKNHLGGVSELTYPTMIVMRSLFDYLIVETVGVGQSETDISNIADTVLFCVQPGSGDSLQFMKAGIVEIPDIIAVTKSDLGEVALNTKNDVANSIRIGNAIGTTTLESMTCAKYLNSSITTIYYLISGY